MASKDKDGKDAEKRAEMLADAERGFPDAEFTPAIVIYIDDGVVKLVDSEIPLMVYLVEYEPVDISLAYEIGDPDSLDYVDIHEIEAVHDPEAVSALIGVYNDGIPEDGEESAIRIE